MLATSAPARGECAFLAPLADGFVRPKSFDVWAQAWRLQWTAARRAPAALQAAFELESLGQHARAAQLLERVEAQFDESGRQQKLGMLPERRQTITLQRTPHVCFAPLKRGSGWYNGAMQHRIFQANEQLEDSSFALFSRDQECSAVALFDGHGGRDCVEFMQREVAGNLVARLALMPAGSADARLAGECAVGALVEADARWAHWIDGNSDRERRARLAQMGACALVALVGRDWVAVANMGDARAALVTRFPGSRVSRTRWLTRAHTLRSAQEYARCAQMARADPFAVRPSMRDLGAHAEIGPALLESLQSAVAPPPNYAEALAVLAGGRAEVAARLGACDPRAGGMVMCSRALGDACLKHERHRISKTHPGAAYVCAVPELTLVERSDSDAQCALVLATDGVWDWLAPEDVEDILVREYEGAKMVNVADQIIAACLERAARQFGMSPYELETQPKGGRLKHMVDDMSVVVIWLGHGPANMWRGGWRKKSQE